MPDDKKLRDIYQEHFKRIESRCTDKTWLKWKDITYMFLLGFSFMAGVMVANLIIPDKPTPPVIVNHTHTYESDNATSECEENY